MFTVFMDAWRSEFCTQLNPLVFPSNLNSVSGLSALCPVNSITDKINVHDPQKRIDMILSFYQILTIRDRSEKVKDWYRNV